MTESALGRAHEVELRSWIGLFKDEARRAVVARRDDLIDPSHRIDANPKLAWSAVQAPGWTTSPPRSVEPSADRAMIEGAIAMAWTALDIAVDSAQRARLNGFVTTDGTRALRRGRGETMITSIFRSVVRLGRTYTPPIETPDGIAELKSVELNGYPQWLLIRGQDVSKPLLLSLHGGPGESNLWLAHYTTRELERRLVCVNWDQRGTGKSARPDLDPATMTIQQFVDDTIVLIELLLARFDQRKLLLLGHSWGSVLAMKVAAARPDLLHAVIGMNQVVDNVRGEDLSYRYVLDRAVAERNRRAIRSLQRLGGSDTLEKDSKFVERMWLYRYGGLVHSVGMGAMVSIMLDAPEYSIADCIDYLRLRSMKFSIPCMRDELEGLDLLREIRELSVPAFFFEGRHDYTAPSVLAEEFYASLQAPYKKLIWFERSAHTPDLEEPEKFRRELIAIADQCCSEERAAGGVAGRTGQATSQVVAGDRAP